MAKFTIYELQNLNSVRKGLPYEGTLRAAKAYATRNQIWQGTLLKIADEEENIVAIKDRQTGEWLDPRDYH